MPDLTLSKLERVDLRNVWTNEGQDFTPWLAKEENLQILGEAIRIDLELEAREKNVGPFRADILCKDTDADTWVVIENQLDGTDHKHLGQLLTYAAGLDAVTIVWVAAMFTNEHRAAMDWLNSITDERFRFFGLEIELWQIGASLPAPKFNVVASPNEWSKSVSKGVRSIESGDLSDVERSQLEYWTKLVECIHKQPSLLQASRKPRPRSWFEFPVEPPEFNLVATMQKQHERIRAALYIRGLKAKLFFGHLQEQKEEIEEVLGYPLDWEASPSEQDARINKQDAYIAVYRKDDPSNQDRWPEQHQWLADRLNDLHEVFASRIKDLNADDWRPDDDDDVEETTD